MPNSTPRDDLLVPTRNGLYCPAGDFHVDPWRPVDRAVVTHGHADHARRGMRHVLTARDGVGILERRGIPAWCAHNAASGEAATAS